LSPSPEAALAAAAFDHCREGLSQALRESVSGKELMARGFGLDIDIAAELNVSENVPRFVNGAFVSLGRHDAGTLEDVPGDDARTV